MCESVHAYVRTFVHVYLNALVSIWADWLGGGIGKGDDVEEEDDGDDNDDVCSS